MPWRVPFNDGQYVDVDTKDKPTDEEIKAAWEKKQKEVPTPLETGATTFMMGMGPTAGGVIGGEMVGGLAAAGLAAADIDPLTAPVGLPLTLAATVVPAGVISAGLDVGERMAMEKASPNIAARVQRGLEANPKSAMVGNLLSGAPFFALNPAQGLKSLGTLGRVITGRGATIPQKQQMLMSGMQAAAGAAQGAIQPLFYGEKPSASGALQGLAAGLLYGRPRTWFERTSPGFKWMRESSENVRQRREEKYASSQQKAAEVYGNVRPQPGQGVREMPVEEGEPGVQPQAEGRVAEGTQVSLDELGQIQSDMVGSMREEASKRGLTIDDSANVPWKPGEVFKSFGSGKMAVNEGVLNRWIGRMYWEGLSPSKIEENVRAKVRHEMIHDRLFREFPNDANGNPHPFWEQLWNSMSAPERLMVEKTYGGKGYSPSALGMEAFRMGVEEAFGPKDEYRTAGFGKLWGLKSLDLMAKAAKKIRQGLSGSDAEVKKLYDRALVNLDFAKALQSEKAPPSEVPPVIGGGPGKEGPAARAPQEMNNDELQARKELLINYLRRVDLQMDAAERRQEATTVDAWRKYKDDAKAEIEKIDRELMRRTGEQSFPASKAPEGQEEDKTLYSVPSKLPFAIDQPYAPDAQRDDLLWTYHTPLEKDYGEHSLLEKGDVQDGYMRPDGQITTVERPITSPQSNIFHFIRSGFLAILSRRDPRNRGLTDPKLWIVRGKPTETQIDSLAEIEHNKGVRFIDEYGTPMIPREGPAARINDERITAAAYRPTGGAVSTGRHHPEILERLGVKGYDTAESRNTPNFGFQTTKRPFITREQASVLAKQNGQNLKEFEPGEPAHSDEIASSKEPGKAISEEAPAALTPEGEEMQKFADKYMTNFKALNDVTGKLYGALLSMGRGGMLWNAALVNATISEQLGVGGGVVGVLERMQKERDFPEAVKSIAAEYLKHLDHQQELLRDPLYKTWRKMAAAGTEGDYPEGYEGLGIEPDKPFESPSEGGFPASRAQYYGDDDLVEKGKTFGSKGWLRPDGEIIKVPVNSNHDLYAKNQALEGRIPGAFRWRMGEGITHFFEQGYLRLNLEHDPVIKKDILHMTGGKPSPVQMRTLSELAQQHGWILRDAAGRDLPGAKVPPTPPPPPHGVPPHGVPTPPVHPPEVPILVEGAHPTPEERPPTERERVPEVTPEETFAPENAPVITPETAVPLEERGSPIVPLTEEQMAESRGVVPTGAELKPIIEKAVQAASPNYKKFLAEMKQKFGQEQGSDLAPELFQIYMWRELMAAPPERLAKLVSETGVGAAQEIRAIKRQSLSSKALEEMGMSVEEAEETAEAFKSVPRRTKLTQEQLETLTERLEKNEKLRNQTRAIVGAKIMRQILADEIPTYTKKNVTFEDLDFNNPLAKFPGYHEFTPSEAGSPRLLEEIMGDRAMPDRAIAGPNTVSYRMAVLRNRKTGETQVHSVYKNPRRGMMIYNPPGFVTSERRYMPLEKVPEDWAFHGTVLTDEPVHNFYQKFSKPLEFNQAIDRPRALEMSTPLGGAFSKRFLPIESLEAIGEGGSFTGPEADLIRALYGIGPGELEKISKSPFTHPIESPEPAALHKMMRAMEVSQPEDVGEMIRILDSLMEKRELQPWHYQGMAALLKMADAIQMKSPSPMNRDELLLSTIHAAYESFKEHPNQAGFVEDILRNYDWQRARLAAEARPTFEPHPFVAGLASKPPSPVELTYEKPTTGIPIHYEALGGLFTAAVKAGTKPFIGPAVPREMPTATPGAIPGPEMLAESVRRAIEQMPPEFFAEKGYKTLETEKLVDITKVKSTGRVKEFPKKQFGAEFGPEGRVVGPTEKTGAEGPDVPAARIADDFMDDLRLAKGQLLNWIRRSGTRKDIRSTRDGMDRTAELYAVRGSNKIRMASAGGQKATTAEAKGLKTYTDRKEFVNIRKSVIPYQAAMEMQSRRLNFEHEMELRDWNIRKRQARDRGEAFDEPEPQYRPANQPDVEYFNELIAKSQKGIERGFQMTKSPNAETRRTGRRHLKASEELRDLAMWTRDHMDDPVVRATNKAFREVMDSHLGMMLASGENIANREYYIPSVFSGELWDDGMFTFGDERLLGAQQQMPRPFMDPYEAVEAGPYVPVNLDSAVLAQRSMLQGARRVNLNTWAEMLKNMTDQPSGKPVAITPRVVREEVSVYNPETGRNETHFNLRYRVPLGKEEYRVVDIGRNPIAVRGSYRRLVDSLLADSQVPEWPGGRMLLHVKDMLKHGVLLAFDTFHPMRLLQYSSALGGGKWGLFPGTPRWQRGWSALSWDLADLPKAVEAGLIPKEAARWATEPIRVYDRGIIKTTTRHELAQRFLQNGLNATQQADALYRTAVQKFPVIGPSWYKYLVSPLSKFTFDRMTPGFILDNAMSSFEKANARNHTESIDAQMRNIARDVNAFYGNMGRQGFFQNPTFRDLAQLFVLAPMWQEGLLRKEIQFASRLTGVSRLLGRKGDLASYMGPLSFGMMRGLGTYFLLTQVMNLISRRQFTWQNKEDNHEMDAWLPLPWRGKNDGLWVSPLGVFGEWAHDFTRLYQTKPTAWDALRQIAMNKSSPYGRIATILWTQKTPSGEQITSTPRVLASAAGQAAPAPIALGSLVQAGGALAGVPGAVPPQPGQIEQRLAAALLGTKTEINARPEQDIARLADRFMRQQGLKLEPYELVPTDAPSYTKLRAAIRNKDLRGAKNLYQELVKQRTPAQISHAMWLWSRRPFTGNKKAEQLFLYSLSNEQMETYFQAQGNRMAQYQAYLDWVMSQP